MSDTTRLSSALADRYRIERHLGEGGMATVYLASDLKHDRKVALKVLRPELAAVLGAERFVQEIKTTANLQHPHILPLFDSGEADSFLYYVMPFIDGETLRDKLNRETQLDVDEAVAIARDTADALDYAHRQNIIHRDIKPENILMQDGRPIVADFGIALAVSAAAGGRMTETGLSLGTPHYMSPEQATAEKDLTARSDVYSLGSVLYEMLTGSPPHVGSSAQQVIMKIVTDTARPVTEIRKSVPPHVAATTAKALEKLPADRFVSAAQFAAALADPTFTTAGAAQPAAVQSARRRPWVYAAAAVGILVLGALVGMLVAGDETPPPDVVRFALTMPSGHRLVVSTVEDAPFAISPDNQRIVYVGRDSGAVRDQLYVRALDQVAGVPLEGTADAIAPFFSPDGLWVGFHTSEDEKLKKVPVTGGPAITLADDVQNNLASASWGDDGAIVYAAAGLNLARVSGAGGTPEVLTGGDSAASFWPVVLPGGKAVLYLRCTTSCAQHDLAVWDIATSSSTVLVPGAGRGWYVEPGYLVYGTEEGAIYAVPFDPATREITGQPVPLLDGVGSGRAFSARLAVSRSGAMVFLAGSGGGGRRVLLVDRAGRERPLVDRPRQYNHPRFSPDGERLALTIATDGGSRIAVYTIASQTLSQLTFEGSTDRPTWSPDGSRIAFRGIGQWGSDLFWTPADGSGPVERVLEVEHGVAVGTTFWTRDGAWIVTDGSDADTSATDENIYAAATGAERTLRPVVATPAEEETGAVSPDGKWIAYGSDESGQWQVFVRPFLEPGGRWLISPGAGSTPLWASNREVIYLDHATRTLMSAVLTFGTTVGVERTALFDFEPYAYNRSSPEYDVSRDGQTFVVLRSAGQDETGDAVVVLNWSTEIARRMAAQGAR